MNINVTSFSDYRSFLLSYANQKKDSNPRWTYGVWAKSLGLKSTSSITKVVQGQRQPGNAIVEKLVKYFDFSEKQKEHFLDLVALNKIRRNPRLGLLITEKMAASKMQSQNDFIEHKKFMVISSWYYLSIREMVELDDFVEDPKWIEKKFLFNVSASKAKKAIEVLLELNLLSRDKSGRLQHSDGRLITKPDFSSAAVRNYHRQTLENAIASLEKTEVSQREFLASTFVIDREELPKAKKMIREFKSEFVQTLEKKSGDQLYQFQVQFFPLVKDKKGE